MAVQRVEDALLGDKTIGHELVHDLIGLVDAEPSAELQILTVPESLEGRHVMGGKRAHGLCGVILRNCRRNKTNSPNNLNVSAIVGIVRVENDVRRKLK